MANDIKELASRLKKARQAYYNGQPIMTDAAFDILFDELKKLDPNNKAITAVGSAAKSEWQKARHEIPMGSLDKVQTPAEMTDWIVRTAAREDLFITEKLDGISIELIYVDGKLDLAITRGDGLIGEDITVNVRKMRGALAGVPKFNGSLRGEIILLRSLHKKHFSDSANPRNAAGGTAKRLDGTGSEHLDIILYQALGDIEFKTEAEQFTWLKNIGAQIPTWTVFSQKRPNDTSTSTMINDYWSRYQTTNRDKLDYDIDGLVVRINDMGKQTALGDKDMRPKGAIAFKFKHDEAVTNVNDVVWQTGATGRQTPVAMFKPVLLSGANVEKATLHNYTNFLRLKLFPECRIMVSRRNDVIPFVEENLDLNSKNGNRYVYPKACPVCSTANIVVGEYLICPNTDDCPAQITGKIKGWVANLNLLELGDKLIDQLVETGKVSTIADLYRLKISDLSSLDRMGEKSAKKVHAILWQNPAIPLESFLGGLNIPMIGTSMIAKVTGAGYDSLSAIRNMTIGQLENIDGLGPSKAQALYDGLKKNSELIDDILSTGVAIKKKVVGGVFYGKSFAFTGTMVNKRANLETMVVEAGGEIGSGKTLTYLVTSDPNSSSGKAAAARKNGTKCITEEEFLSMAK